MIATNRKFTPTKAIGTTDAPDSKVTDGGRARSDFRTLEGAICVYAGHYYGVGSKVCMTGLVHQCGSNEQWFNLVWKC